MTDRPITAFERVQANPSGERLSDQQLHDRVLWLRAEQASMERADARERELRGPVPELTFEDPWDHTGLVDGPNGSLIRRDGRVLEQDPGTPPKSVPRNGRRRGIDARLYPDEDATIGGSMFEDLRPPAS